MFSAKRSGILFVFGEAIFLLTEQLRYLVGPCALEYTKMRAVESYLTDPSADELVQRHRIHSGGTLNSQISSPGGMKSPKKPSLQVNTAVF